MEHFGHPNRPKIASSRLLNPHFLQKVDFQKNERHRGREHDFDPKTAPKTTQDRPKTAPRRSSRAFFFRLRFRHRFWSVLGRNLASSWLPFGLQNRRKLERPTGLVELKTTLTTQDGPRAAQDPSKTPKDPPRPTQKTTQTPPKRPKIDPRPSQNDQSSIHPSSSSLIIFSLLLLSSCSSLFALLSSLFFPFSSLFASLLFLFSSLLFSSSSLGGSLTTGASWGGLGLILEQLFEQSDFGLNFN